VTDPRQILGIGPNATEEEIRAAYLQAIKLHPPESSPEEFERIRDAYQALRDPRSRARTMLFGGDPLPPLTSLLNGLPAERQFVGPELWLAALKGSNPRP
jgi:curved DNA-binding protein CbpA